MNDEQLDHLLGAVRNDQPSQEQAAAARDAVWQKLADSSICSDFRLDFASYTSGELPEARRLLVDDHLSRCPHCRRVLLDRSKPAVIEIKAIKKRASGKYLGPWARWAAAATFAAVSLYAGRDKIDRAMAPSGPRARLEAGSGGVFLLAKGALHVGDSLFDGDFIRTGARAHAVLRLVDGSRIELNERTELHLETAWSGETIQLDRGDLLVEAAKQRRGRLRVVTRDSMASVKGTVFAVSADAAGSLVSVVEGSVAVAQPGIERVLAAGENSATNGALARINVHQAVAWSDQAEKYFSMLAALTSLEKDIAQLPAQALRTDPKLLRYLPAGARIYVAFPNLNGTIVQALNLFEQRAQENATLSEWWGSAPGQEIKQAIERIQTVTQFLGDEIAVVNVTQATENFPLLLAQVQPGQQQALQTAMLQLAQGHPVLPYRITPDLLMIADSTTRLDVVALLLGTGATSPFATQIRARYLNGVGWLSAVDVSAYGMQRRNSATRILGSENIRTAFFEQRSAGGADDLDATVTFNGARTGIASWLAAPGSEGSMEYVSAETQIAFSASTRDPRQAFEEILQLAGQDDLLHLQKFETETGISVRSDIAGALGTDFTVSLERVTLPMPGWVAAVEVLQQDALDSAVQRLVDAANRSLPAGTSPLVLRQETANGRVWRSLQTPLAGATVHWTYDRGYMIASADRALALRAIAVRDSGLSLPRSTTFRQAVPQGNLHHSAYLWVNVNAALADAATLIDSPALKSLVGARTPVLITLDGEMEQIRASSRTRLTSLVLDLMLTSGAAGARGAP